MPKTTKDLAVASRESAEGSVSTERRHPKNGTDYKSLDRVAADPRVVRIWDEGREDGIWVELAPGYNWEGHSCVHEWTVRDVLAAFSTVTQGAPR